MEDRPAEPGSQPDGSYDVVIAGGGLAGCAAAITLGRLGLRALVAERSAAPQSKPGESLPPASRRLLGDLDILQRLDPSSWLPIHANVSCWESAELTERQFVFDPDGHGWRVDRVSLEAAAQAAAQANGATLVRGQPLPEIAREQGAWALTIGGQSLRTSWLIDATGRSRFLARQCGATVDAADHQLALFARFASAAGADRDTRTLVEAIECGWFYTALLPSGERIVVFHTDPDLPSCKRARHADGFREYLAQTLHIKALLGDHGYQMVSDPRPKAANSSRLDQIHGEGWLAVGDAAISFDPLSSQGMHTALYAGLRGAEHLARRIRGEDAEALNEFAARINRIYATHLRHRSAAYEIVRRWPNSDYWRRRQTVI